MDVQRTDEQPGGIDDQELVDAVRFHHFDGFDGELVGTCLLYTSPSPRDHG